MEDFFFGDSIDLGSILGLQIDKLKKGIFCEILRQSGIYIFFIMDGLFEILIYLIGYGCDDKVIGLSFEDLFQVLDLEQG